MVSFFGVCLSFVARAGRLSSGTVQLPRRNSKGVFKKGLQEYVMLVAPTEEAPAGLQGELKKGIVGVRIECFRTSVAWWHELHSRGVLSGAYIYIACGMRSIPICFGSVAWVSR